MPSMLGTNESIQEISAAGTNRRHPRHGAGKTLPPFFGPGSKTPMLARGQESHPARHRGRTACSGKRPGWLCPVPATDPRVCGSGHPGNPPKHRSRQKKESRPPSVLLAQEEEIQQLIARFESGGVVRPEHRRAGNPGAHGGFQIRQCLGGLITRSQQSSVPTTSSA